MQMGEGKQVLVDDIAEAQNQQVRAFMVLWSRAANHI